MLSNVVECLISSHECGPSRGVLPVATPDMSAASAAGGSPRVHPQATLKVPGLAFSIVSGAPLAEHSIALQTTAADFNIGGGAVSGSHGG